MKWMPTTLLHKNSMKFEMDSKYRENLIEKRWNELFFFRWFEMGSVQNLLSTNKRICWNSKNFIFFNKEEERHLKNCSFQSNYSNQLCNLLVLGPSISTCYMFYYIQYLYYICIHKKNIQNEYKLNLFNRKLNSKIKFWKLIWFIRNINKHSIDTYFCFKFQIH